MSHATELQWIPVIADPDLTALQHTHQMARSVQRNGMELDVEPQDALDAVNRALRCYRKAALRPRKAACWSYVACQMWNARQDAERSGAVVVGDFVHDLVSSCYTDAQLRSEHGHAMELAGHADVRV